MSKELVISITSQETKAAILENDQLVEIHIERDKDHGIVGAICKGRVTKVLPGMQSAFVDIGLDRDAFLYVSDFFEDTEEYDKLVSSAEEQVAKLGQAVPPLSREATTAPTVPETLASPPQSNVPSNNPASNVVKYQDRRGRSRRSRRFRLRGKHYEGTASAQSVADVAPAVSDSAAKKTPAGEQTEPRLSLLPGESLAKYQSSPAEPMAQGAMSAESAVDEEEGPGDNPSAELDELEAADERVLQAVELFEAGEAEKEATGEPLSPISLAAHVTPGPVAVVELATVPTGSAESPGTAVSASVAGLGEEKTALALDTNADPTKSAEGAEPWVEVARDGQLPASVLLTVATELPALGEISLESTDLADYSMPVESERPDLVTERQARAVQPGEPPNAGSDSAAASGEASLPEAQVASQAAATAPGTVSSSKVQFRSSPGAPRFLRRMDRRKRQNLSEDRHEAGTVSYPLIGDLLKEGQEILVQIAKEPLGTKGARITSHIALPGRYLVYMPTVDHIGVSRKVESDEERQRLKRIIQENRRSNFPGGFIVRTAGQGKGEEEFKSDINFLYALWAEVRSRADKKRGPALVHRDLNLVQRILRDQLSGDFSNIRVDNETEYTSIVEFINRFQPSLVSRVKLYTKDTPIFEEFGIQNEIDKALRNKVWLKSGGYIVIDQAEALVAIDVNTGKYVGKSNKLEDTIVKTNIEAAREIARQIRLRDLGGIIVCDFIDMEDRKNRLKVTQTLEEALRTDKSPSKILQFNDFGLVAITRKRVKQSLMRTLCEPCSHCGGSGMVKSAQTVCYEIQGEVKKMAKALENKDVTIRVAPEVAKALKSTEASVIQEIESSLKRDVVIKTDPLLHRERFDIF
jgi:Rne/Rng family ribonuclease